MKISTVIIIFKQRRLSVGHPILRACFDKLRRLVALARVVFLSALLAAAQPKISSRLLKHPKQISSELRQQCLTQGFSIDFGISSVREHFNQYCSNTARAQAA